MKSNKTLYVTDLDGTLLNTKDRINSKSIQIINELVARGMLFTYATARSLVSASVVTQGLTTDIPVIAYNGALIIHPRTGEILSSLSFTKEEAEFVRNNLEHHNISPLVYSYIEQIEKVSWNTTKENEGIKRYLSNRKGDKRLRQLSNEEGLYDGDAINDIPMFEISDECYAVENAVPELKELATGIVKSNDNDGIAKWLLENVKI